MLFTELYNYLIKPENKDLFVYVLGVTQAEYKILYNAFIKTGAKDKTTRLTVNDKLLALILIKRFQFVQEQINKIILPGAVKATRDAFGTTVLPRLDKALEGLPNIGEKLASQNAPVSFSKRLGSTYANFDNVLNAIHLATVKNVIVTGKVRIMNKSWINNYLPKSVNSKTKTGQSSFLQILNCLMYDMDNVDERDSYIAWYIAIVFNFHVHNATYAPLPGYGKAQQREMDHIGLYARSQSKHIIWTLFKLLMGVGLSKQCLLPRNDAVFKILDNEIKSTFTRNLKKYDKNGCLKKDEDSKGMGYFALPLAYSGLRSSAYNVTLKGVRYFLDAHSHAELIEKVKENLYIPAVMDKPIAKVSVAKLKERVAYVHHLASKLHEEMSKRDYYSNLYSNLTRHRYDVAKNIYEKSLQSDLKNIKISHDKATCCLDVYFYPGQKIEDCADYSEGVTNVIINFFTGLLNHKVKCALASIHAQRRQSFAFNRIAITDTTSMCMRVSLGYEPEFFADIFIETLKSLDKLLVTYNFLKKDNPGLKKGFEIVEKSRKKDQEATKGTQFLNFVRSNKRASASIIVAGKALLHHLDKQNGEALAFKDYIDYIVGDLQENALHVQEIKNDNVKIIKSAKNNILVIGLLNNLLKYTLDKIQQSTDISNSDEYLHSYCLIISKLVKYCYKAFAWLKHHTEYEASHVYAKSLLLVDDILENLIALDGLYLIHCNEDANNSTALKKLTKTELTHASASFGIAENKINVFYTDNGQQALTVSLLTMNMQMSGDNRASALSDKIYTFSKCYFELFDNLKKNLELTPCRKAVDAEYIYVDVREIDEFKKVLPMLNGVKDVKAKKSVKDVNSLNNVVIIDYTHKPDLQNAELKNITHELLKKNIWVVIVGSMLKHEQLGCDKFQAGKIIIFSPEKCALLAGVRDELNGVTKAAMHPVAASFFQMIYDISCDKVLRPTFTTSQLGIFADKQGGIKSNEVLSHKGCSLTNF